MRENCRDCGEPREPDSSAASYCKTCVRRRQRDRYKERREALGFEVNPTSSEETLRQRLMRMDGKPGKCMSCGEYEEGELRQIFVRREGELQKTLPAGFEPADEWFVRQGDAFMVVCALCEGVLRYLTYFGGSEACTGFDRAVLGVQHIKARGISYETVMIAPVLHTSRS